MIGNHKKMLNVFDLIRKFALVDYPVLITGDTGTGKELVARAIYEKSERTKHSFISINCTTIPKDLFESEIFGYERGAFTGAYRKKIGLAELADKGVLFLDEIGDLPLAAQPKLLRLIETSQLNRLGSDVTISINIRIIAATNKNIEKMVEENNFREDLYHRLSTFRIHLPQLAERGEDILTLANFFMNKFSNELGYKPREFTKEAKELMLNYTWPGNIRELINKVRRAIVTSDNHEITSHDLELPLNKIIIKPLKEHLWDCEKETLLNAIEYSTYNMSQVANKLCISRQNLYKLLKKYKIKVQDKNIMIDESRIKPRVNKTFKALLIYDDKKVKGYIKNISSRGCYFISSEKIKSLKDLKCTVQIIDIGTELEYTVVWEKIVKNTTYLGLALFSS